MNFSNASSPIGIDPRVARAAEIVRELLKNKPAPGHYTVDGEDFCYNVMRYETAPRETRRFENHRRFIDIHVVLEGTEFIDVSTFDMSPLGVSMFDVSNGNLERATDYDAAGDCEFFTPRTPGAPSTTVLLRPGELLTLAPGEAHRPGVYPEAHEVLKVVFKLSCGNA